MLLIVATGCGGVVRVPGHGGPAPADAGHDVSVEAAPADAGADAAAGGWWTPEAGPCTDPLDCSPYLDSICIGGQCCNGFAPDDAGCFCGEYAGCPPGQGCCGGPKGYLECRTDCHTGVHDAAPLAEAGLRQYACKTAIDCERYFGIAAMCVGGFCCLGVDNGQGQCVCGTLYGGCQDPREVCCGHPRACHTLDCPGF